MLGFASPVRARGAPSTNWLIDFEDLRRHLGVPTDDS
jgi:hypothetical protein